MKKLLVLFVCLLMVLGAVGCKPKDDRTVLVFWGHQNDAWNASWREIAKKFEADNPDIRIQFEFFPYDEFEAKATTSLIKKEQGADIYEMWGGWGVDFAPTGVLAALPDDLAKMIKEEFYAPTYGALEVNGKIYGFPLEFNIECGGLIVNNDLLKEVGAKIPTTWNELISEAKKAVKFDGELMRRKGFEFVNWDSTPYLFSSMILSKGGQYLDANGKFTYNTAIGREAYQTLADLIDVVTDMDGISGGGDMEGYQLLFAGECMFAMRGPWVIPEGVEEFKLTYGKEFTYVELPWWGSEKKFPTETGWAVAINSGSANTDAAFRFLKFVAHDDILLQHNIACAQIPAKKAVAQDPELLKEVPFFAPLVKLLDGGQFIGFFNTDILKEAITENFEEFINGDYDTVADALAALDARLNEAINK